MVEIDVEYAACAILEDIDGETASRIILDSLERVPAPILDYILRLINRNAELADANVKLYEKLERGERNNG